MSNHRTKQLKQWVGEQLSLSSIELQAMPAQLSFRSFYRIEGVDQKLIAMDSPPPNEVIQSENQKTNTNVFDANQSFVNISGWLRQQGLNAPEVLAQDLTLGFLLVSDLGSHHYYDAYTKSSPDLDRLYHDAVDALCVMQAADCSMLALPVIDEARLREELNRCSQWLVGEYLGDDIESVFPDWSSVCDLLTENIVSQPQVFVHLDYHSQNLLICEQDNSSHPVAHANPGILDFQDAVIGPISLDIVSYLRDLYIIWPAKQRLEWLKYYWQQANANNIPVGNDFKQFKGWFDFMGMHRHLRCTGNFTRGHFQQGKSRYLQYLPSTIEQVIDTATNYPEFDTLVSWLRKDVLPRVITKNQTILDNKACA